jgi:hypothetical protein
MNSGANVILPSIRNCRKNSFRFKDLQWFKELAGRRAQRYLSHSIWHRACFASFDRLVPLQEVQREQFSLPACVLNASLCGPITLTAENAFSRQSARGLHRSRLHRLKRGVPNAVLFHKKDDFRDTLVATETTHAARDCPRF